MVNNEAKIEDVIIIGGGPAGLAAAVYTARSNLSTLMFAGAPYGGQLMLTSDVENYPGFESILGPELIEKMRSHVKQFGTRILDQNVTKVDLSKQPFAVSTYDQNYQTKAIIIATGAKALWLGLENETRLRGKGISACATCDGFFFKDKVVAVVGGGDTAMEEALFLTKFAKEIHLVHRRDSFRASKIMQDRVLNHPKIKVIWNSEIVDVLGQERVEGVKIQSTTDKKQQEMKVDGLFVAIGHKPDTDLFKGQIELDRKGYIITAQRFAIEYFKTKYTPETQTPGEIARTAVVSGIEGDLESLKSKFNTMFNTQTSVTGVFAAGDCVDFVYRQAATASGRGVAAALEVERWLEQK